MLSVEKPGTPAEILEHHGTKGMKWGVRKSSREFAGRFPTSAARTREIHRARTSVGKSRKKMETAAGGNTAKYNKARRAYLNNPDRATAQRMTRGEKVVAGLLYTMAPIPLVPLATAGVVGTTYVKRRRREKGK